MSEKRLKTIGIKAAAYEILKKESEERVNTTKPDSIVDIATEAIVRTFGSGRKKTATSGAAGGMEA